MALTLIIKGTRKCNLRCAYCHDWRDFGSSLSYQQLDRLIEKAQKSDNIINYVWHGGEPLLLGVEWYEAVVELQKKYKHPNNIIRNSIQTNGVLLNDKWCDFLKKNKFSIGVSIDGPEILHNKTRYDYKNNGTYKDVISGLNILRRNDIQYGILLVVTNDIINYGSLEIYNWAKSTKTHRISFLSQRPDTKGLKDIRRSSVLSEYLPKRKYAKFLKEIFQYWWAEDGKEIEIREFQSIIEGFINGKPSLCVYAGSCAGKYFGVEPNGFIYHCDKYIPEKDFQIGSIDDIHFEFNNPIVEQIKETTLKQENEIKQNCTWYEVCHGGCPNDRYSDPSEIYYETKCCGMSELIEDIYEKLLSTTS